MTGEYDALEDFAGPGGWDEGAKLLGLRFYGIDHDKAACDTARAAGHHREQADVTEHPSPEWAHARGHVSSPSCTLFSMAGSGIGRLVIDILAQGICRIFRGDDPTQVRAETHTAIYPIARAEAVVANGNRTPTTRWNEDELEDRAWLDAKIAALVLEPARRIIELDPTWIALEQVPQVLPLWQVYEYALRERGYSAWTVVLDAADYGVAQNRRRAILGASRQRFTGPPEPTHAEQSEAADLFGGSREKWVSMYDVLGWGMSERPYPTIACSRSTGGPDKEKVGGSGARASIYAERDAGRWVLRASNAAHAAVRPMTRPAPTVLFAGASNDVRWYPEGHTEAGVAEMAGTRCGESVRLDLVEAGVLQSFRADYPWHGNQSQRFQQVGNAIPPLLAAHVLAAVTGVQLPSEVAV